MWIEVLPNDDKSLDKFVNIVKGFSCIADVIKFEKEPFKRRLKIQTDSHAYIYDDGIFQIAMWFKSNNDMIQVLQCVVKYDFFNKEIKPINAAYIIGEHFKTYMKERNGKHMYMRPLKEEEIKYSHVLGWFGKQMAEAFLKVGVKSTRIDNYWEWEVV